MGKNCDDVVTSPRPSLRRDVTAFHHLTDAESVQAASAWIVSQREPRCELAARNAANTWIRSLRQAGAALRTRRSQRGKHLDTEPAARGGEWIVSQREPRCELAARNAANTWIRSLRQASVSHRLTLLYVANDVVQTCKRRDALAFRDAFAGVLPEAMQLARGDAGLKKAVERIVTIWEQRKTYPKEIISQLRAALVGAPQKEVVNTKILTEFRVSG
ncbi:uncharacterized protein LOC144954111, partial [Lampetra fluviatilis]